MVIPNKNRNIGLDVARTIAILLVLFAHTLWISGNYPKVISLAMQLSGTIGVEVFFIISGFLIGKIILREISKPTFSLTSIRTFLIRRWIRTFPNYYLILIVNILLWYWFYNRWPEALYKYFIYLQNFSSPSPDFYRISWSLSVEQFSYLIVPILLYLTILLFPAKNRRRIFLYVTLIVVVLFTVPRIVFYFNNSLSDIVDWNENIRKVLIYRLDVVYIGFLFRYMYEEFLKWMSSNKSRLFVIGMGIILILHVFRSVLGITVNDTPFFMIVLYLPINSIGICLLLPWLMEYDIKSKLLKKFFITISLLSYSIYLLHYSIILHLLKTVFPSDQLTGFSLWAYTFLFWGLTIICSYFLYKYFERPITDLRDNKRLKTFFKLN